MPKVQMQTLESGELEIKYQCECGSPVKFITYIKPRRLPKCFDCNIYCQPIDEPVEKYIEDLRSKQESRSKTNRR